MVFDFRGVIVVMLSGHKKLGGTFDGEQIYTLGGAFIQRLELSKKTVTMRDG